MRSVLTYPLHLWQTTLLLTKILTGLLTYKSSNVTLKYEKRYDDLQNIFFTISQRTYFRGWSESVFCWRAAWKWDRLPPMPNMNDAKSFSESMKADSDGLLWPFCNPLIPYWSYTARLCGSVRTSWAYDISLNLSPALGFLSGWYSLANFLYAYQYIITD